MKKFGFTLAEVLITLTIIGVVAVVSLPMLITNTEKAQIPPKLAKVQTTFTNGARILLAQEGSESLFSAISPSRGNPQTGIDFARALSHNLKITPLVHTDGTTVNYHEAVTSYNMYTDSTRTFVPSNNHAIPARSDDGMLYYFVVEAPQRPHTDYPNIPSNRKIGELIVDINGTSNPNAVGIDTFKFMMYDDGTLRPWGQKQFNRRVSSASTSNEYWNGTHRCNETEVVPDTAWTCTGSIFDNNMKVIYR